MLGGRMVGKTERMQRLVQPITASITGKHPARSVAAVSGWRQSDDQESGIRITEARQWFCPILHALITARWILCRCFTPAYQARTFTALDNATVQLLEGDHVSSRGDS